VRSNPVVRRGLALLLAASLLMAALGSTASAASRRVAVGAFLNTTCSTIRVYGDWTANPDQTYITISLTDLITDGSASQSIALSPTQTEAFNDFFFGGSTDIHRFLATATITDGSNNVLLSGKARLRLPCSG
jgi:hypothetical protein